MFKTFKHLIFIALAAVTTTPCFALDSMGKFKLCESESFMSLHMARNYLLLSKRDKNSVLAYINKDDQFANNVAKDLFEGVEGGKIQHYADFATTKLMTCIHREDVEFSKPESELRLCFTRVDIPFFLSTFKDQGLSKSQAIERASRAFQNQRVYPTALVNSVAAQMFPPGPETNPDELMKKSFWACVFSDEWSKSN
jgi:hypothetical protein